MYTRPGCPARAETAGPAGVIVMAARGHCQCRWNQKITTVWPVRPQNIDRIYWISGNISAEMTSFDAFWSYLSLVVFDHSNGIQRVLAATITDRRISAGPARRRG